MKAVEKPSPYYPSYYLLRWAPDDVRYRLSHGKDPDTYREYLERKEDHKLRKWIESSGIPHDLVFDLHDNTEHPKVWKYKGKRIEYEGIGFRTDDGFVAAKVDNQISVSYHSVLPKFEEYMQAFRSNIKPKILYEIESYDPVKIGVAPVSETEIGFEFYPVRIDRYSGKLQRLSVRQGSNFFLELLDYIRKSYS